MKMSFRRVLTIVTLILLAVVIFFAWPELVKAWGLIGRIDWWILALVIPVQLLSYYATGGMVFAYLRRKGNLQDTSHWQMTRIALELNFVNHILPIGGAAGFSYLGWILGKHGVTPGRTTAAQLVRYTLTFITFVILLVIAALLLILDHSVNRTILMLCALLVVAAIVGTFFVIVIISSRQNLLKFSGFLTRLVNRIGTFFTRGRNKQVIKDNMLETFFMDLHDDYLAIRRDIRVLTVPFIWALIANILDVALLFIAFWSLGTAVNPAALFIAFGLSSIGGVIAATPGGAGAYEVIMVAFLAATGVEPEVAIAGVLLARVTLVLGTIIFGYFFYQLTINKYGTHPTQR